jgi:hypothetical protein
VLAVARRLGTPTVAARVGGMGELATRTFAVGDADDLTRAIDAVLATSTAVRPAPSNEIDEAVSVHLRAYGLAA